MFKNKKYKTNKPVIAFDSSVWIGNAGFLSSLAEDSIVSGRSSSLSSPESFLLLGQQKCLVEDSTTLHEDSRTDESPSFNPSDTISIIQFFHSLYTIKINIILW